MAEVAGCTAGSVLGGRGRADAAVTSVSVDTRSLAPGALFVALRAERDGHDFVADAFGRGASAALVERTDGLGDLPAGAVLVVVADSAAGLSALGRLARDRLDDVPVVGITGSSGKTSTKDLTAAALGSRRRVCASPGSFNNELGVPLTLLSADPDTEALVVEMGARGLGHIAELVTVARPTVGVITNIGMAHAEFFGCRAEVARAKGELVEGLPAGGTAVLCADDDMTPALSSRTRASVLTAGLGPTADVRVSGLTLDAELRPSFRLMTPWGDVDVAALPVRGAHQATNAALAVAVAGALGVGPEAAAAGLAEATGAPWRMELRRTAGGVLVLNDAYNANPASMAAALDALAALDGGGRRFAVLGHMAELGACSDDEHRRLGRLAAGCGLAAVVAVGPEAAPLAEGARDGGADVVVVDTPEAAVSALAGRLRPGDAVLVKASRVAGLERVAAALVGGQAQ
jgi:UDP-N-acetylmuramoyl-tripeptide--D-alanyl-D-alanine ligase